MTQAAATYLETIYPRAGLAHKMVVIPTCADLDRFVPGPSPASDEHVYGCVGSVLSGWFRIDWLGRFFEAALSRDDAALFQIITKDDPALVEEALAVNEAVQRRLTICAMSPRDIHRAVQGHFASIMFFHDGLGKLGSSPTRMGEVLGCGIPVVANRGVGDVEEIIDRHHIGVLVDDASELEMDRAITELDRLIADPGLAERCRATAERLFSLRSGIDAYGQIYERLQRRVGQPLS
ncbi:MAG: glycosyltransferase [Rhizobiaceae bacterium]|nr:MAG: glycosyltransferase [Rhizobiaceae bacterium]